MKRKATRFLALAVSAVLVTSLTACGDGSDENAKDAVTPVEAQPMLSELELEILNLETKYNKGEFAGADYLALADAYSRAGDIRKQRDMLLPHHLIEVRPRREQTLTPDIIPGIEHAIQDLDSQVGHTDLVDIREAHTETFQSPSKKMGDVFGAVLDKYSALYQLRNNPAIATVIYQQNETDWTFIRRIANQDFYLLIAEILHYILMQRYRSVPWVFFPEAGLPINTLYVVY